MWIFTYFESTFNLLLQTWKHQSFVTYMGLSILAVWPGFVLSFIKTMKFLSRYTK